MPLLFSLFVFEVKKKKKKKKKNAQRRVLSRFLATCVVSARSKLALRPRNEICVLSLTLVLSFHRDVARKNIRESRKLESRSFRETLFLKIFSCLN